MIKIVELFSCVLLLINSCGEGNNKIAVAEDVIESKTMSDFIMPLMSIHQLRVLNYQKTLLKFRD